LGRGTIAAGEFDSSSDARAEEGGNCRLANFARWRYCSGMSWSKAWKYLIAAVVIIAIIVAFFRPSDDDDDDDAVDLPLTTVITDARAGLVGRMEVRGDDLEVTRKDGTVYDSRKEADTSLITVLSDAGVDVGEVEIRVESPSIGNWIGLVIGFLPLLLIGGLIWCCVRRSRSGA
jgi:hypothetical protein